MAKHVLNIKTCRRREIALWQISIWHDICQVLATVVFICRPNCCSYPRSHREKGIRSAGNAAASRVHMPDPLNLFAHGIPAFLSHPIFYLIFMTVWRLVNHSAYPNFVWAFFSPHPCNQESNKGYDILSKMGWHPDTGLGRNLDGRRTVVPPMVTTKCRRGLG